MSAGTKRRKPRPNLGEIAYDEIKSMILTGELTPGQRLVLDDLSDRLNLSTTPIRDALHRLAQEDLIVITPRTSHSVVQISAGDAADILDLRLLLETYALQTAGRSLAEFPVDRFRQFFKEPPADMAPMEFIAIDNEFHNTILALSPNHRLPKMYSYLQNLIQVISIQAIRSTGRIAEANREHLALLDAIESQDVQLAMRHLREHFEQMKSVAVRSTETQGCP